MKFAKGMIKKSNGLPTIGKLRVVLPLAALASERPNIVELNYILLPLSLVGCMIRKAEARD